MRTKYIIVGRRSSNVFPDPYRLRNPPSTIANRRELWMCDGGGVEHGWDDVWHLVMFVRDPPSWMDGGNGREKIGV